MHTRNLGAKHEVTLFCGGFLTIFCDEYTSNLLNNSLRQGYVPGRPDM